jgi:hypothetical protein
MSPISNSVLHQPPLPRLLLAHGLARHGAGDDARAAKGQGAGGKHRPSLAQRLAPWLAWADAIALAGALDAASPTPASPARAAAAGRDASAALEAARHALTQGIDRDEPEGVDAAEWPADATPGRRYRAHQQAMASRIGPLRVRVRSALAAQSTALGRVAMLDHRIEQALGARERQLLAAVPAWLDRRLQRDPAPALEVMQPLLHAELAHRLQPVAGMVAAIVEWERAA